MRRWNVLLSVVLLLVICSAAMACPLCKDTIANTPDPQGSGALPGGFNTSIYVMLGGLFAVVGMVITVILKGIRG